MVGLALELLRNDTVDRVILVTNDIPLGEAAESLLPQDGSTIGKSLGFAVANLRMSSARILYPNLTESVV